ncbi:acrB/AcrD/AcrF family protein, partial [Vibrio harveyi]
TQSKSLLLFG